MTAFKAGDSQLRRAGRSTGLGVEFDIYWLAPEEVERRATDAAVPGVLPIHHRNLVTTSYHPGGEPGHALIDTQMGDHNGVNHIDTADAYGPYITNEIIREALFPYGDHVHIATKVGVVRDEQGGWLPANSPRSLRGARLGCCRAERTLSSQRTGRGFISRPATRKYQVKGLIAGNGRRVFRHPVPAQTPGS